ncbi:MAG: sensor histidine kinase [Clostridia bacterium]|nr:sensor histidine kinase [Clostridia bacterium]
MGNVKFIGSFRFKLIVMLVALIIIPLILFSFLLFNWVKDIISEKYSDSAIQSVYESSKNIDFRLNDLREYSNIILTNRDFISILNNIKNTEPLAVENLLRSFFTSREDIEGIYVYSGDYAYSIGSNKVLTKSNDAAWYKELSNTEGEIKWIDTRHEKIRIMAGDFDKYYFSIGRKLIDINTLEELGIIMMDIDEGILEKTYRNLMSEGDVEVFICDRDGNVISHPDKKQIGSNISQESYAQKMLTDEKSFGRLSYKKGTKDNMILYSTCATTGWKLVKIIPNNYLYREIDSIKNFVVVIGTVYVMVALLVALLFSLKITKPIINMMKKMKEAETGNLDISIKTDRKDEIGQLGVSFNNMIFKIKTLIGQLVEEERIKKEIELEVLHAQINPHFLYNTLNTIKWMAKMQGAKNISATVTALIKLLRVSINLSNEMIPLRDEVEYVKNYVLIQKVRFNEQFEINYDIAEDCMDCLTPKMILQPVVENSIIHGWKEGNSQLSIGVSARRQENNVVIEVTDNGTGIEEDILRKIFKAEKNVNKFSVVGLNNVNERIKLYFGESYGIHIVSEVGKGTTVKINLPYTTERREA